MRFWSPAAECYIDDPYAVWGSSEGPLKPIYRRSRYDADRERVKTYTDLGRRETKISVSEQLQVMRNRLRPLLRAVRAFEIRPDLLWGPRMDYWTALKNNLVSEAEQRAVGLLSEVCDKERFNIYLATGNLPCLGNVTKRTYMLKRIGGADYINNGRVVTKYCILIEDTNIPPTDGVIVLKGLIEGEEQTFLKIAKTWGPGMSAGHLKTSYIPHLAPFISKEWLSLFCHHASEIQNELKEKREYHYSRLAYMDI